MTGKGTIPYENWLVIICPATEIDQVRTRCHLQPQKVVERSATQRKVEKMVTTFTSESVCSGHPDKICDQISDAIVDAALSGDPHSRVAVETLVTENFVAMAGEVTSKVKLNYERIARSLIKKLGYDDPALRFTHESPMSVNIHTQSPDIKVGVDNLGAGDQGMMYGYACRETDELMPLPIMLAHRLTMQIDQKREEKNSMSYLRPDGKSQVTVRYVHGKPISVESVVLAVPHKEGITLSQVHHDLYKKVVTPVLDAFGYTISPKNVIVNGTGVWHLSGPAADTGVTGRKIVVDTYGGMAKVGGGAFSGKDPTKVDRSAAYAARFLAKNIVAAGFADKCEVRLAYFIGAKKPIMQEVDTFGTAKVEERKIRSFMRKILDTSVAGILETFDLRRPLYLKTATYGHFGRNEFPWEKVVV
ncbi:MAG TPA: methionine adenosyltransferase [Patescibacteria group bacterium]|nr:methionine adenosyltransferase [Patescibacteria group bacterium]